MTWVRDKPSTAMWENSDGRLLVVEKDFGDGPFGALLYESAEAAESGEEFECLLEGSWVDCVSTCLRWLAKDGMPLTLVRIDSLDPHVFEAEELASETWNGWVVPRFNEYESWRIVAALRASGQTASQNAQVVRVEGDEFVREANGSCWLGAMYWTWAVFEE